MEYYQMGLNFCGTKLSRMADFYYIHSFYYLQMLGNSYYIAYICYIAVIIQ